MTTRDVSAFGTSVALHLMGFAILWSTSAPAPQRALNKDGHRVIAAFIVAEPEDTRFAGLKPIIVSDDWPFDISSRSSSVSLGQFSFDVSKIVDRALVLFPFLTPGLSFEHFQLTPRRALDRRVRNPFATNDRQSSIRTINRPLVLSGVAVQSVIDAAWGRRDRWNKFQRIITLSEIFSPTDGTLATVLQKYREQNWVQPYVDQTTRDSRLWVELGLAADHVDFVGFIRRYASQHPGTKATVELLFFLDKIAQANRSILLTLLETDPETQLTWTRDANRSAYDLVTQLRRYYVDQLGEKWLFDSVKALEAHYDKVRLTILSGLLRATPDGYRVSDALFLIGAIHWKQGKEQDAFRSWQEMKIDQTDSYVRAYSEILNAFRSYEAHSSLTNQKIAPSFRLEIQRILDAQRGRERMFSLDRLRQFGYHVDTF